MARVSPVFTYWTTTGQVERQIAGDKHADPTNAMQDKGVKGSARL